MLWQFPDVSRTLLWTSLLFPVLRRAVARARAQAAVNPVPFSAFNPGPMTGNGNWTWLIPGRVPTLVDAGVGDPRHLDAVEAALGGAALAQVLVTHGHVGSRVGRAGDCDADDRRARSARCRGPSATAVAGATGTSIADGDAIDAGDTSLTAVHTPGHAPDHLCFWHERAGRCSAAISPSRARPFVPAAPHGDLTAYLASLERDARSGAASDPARAWAGHRRSRGAAAAVSSRTAASREGRFSTRFDPA